MLWIECELLNLQKRCAQAQILCKLILLKYLRLICSEAWKPRQAITRSHRHRPRQTEHRQPQQFGAAVARPETLDSCLYSPVAL